MLHPAERASVPRRRVFVVLVENGWDETYEAHVAGIFEDRDAAEAVLAGAEGDATISIVPVPLNAVGRWWKK